MVGIVYEDRARPRAAFMAGNGAGWTAGMDPGEARGRGYGIYGPPETFFIGRDGIVARQLGQLSAADAGATPGPLIIEE